jgi:phage terminase small subunit
MNPKQQLFCDYYLSGISATQAYIKAGYSKNGADRASHRLLKNAEICREVNKQQQKNAEIAMLSKEKLLNKISTQIESVDFEGLDTIKLIEIYNKMTGYNQPVKVEHSGELTMKGILSELRERRKNRK